MRKVVYSVSADGKIFNTSSYAEATKSGNHIIKTFCEAVADEDAEKANKAIRERLARHRGN